MAMLATHYMVSFVSTFWVLCCTLYQSSTIPVHREEFVHVRPLAVSRQLFVEVIIQIPAGVTDLKKVILIRVKHQMI